MLVSKDELDTWQDRRRAHFINCLSGYKSANLLGTQDKTGQTNLAIVSSVVHLGANPALVGLVIRPHSVSRHSLENLLETKCYTLNQVHRGIIEQAHQTSARYDKQQSEFKEVNLTPLYTRFAAPYVAESRCRLGVQLQSTQTLVNGTEFVIGEIQEVYIEDEAAVAEDGFVDLARLNTACVTGLDSYHEGPAGLRYTYAKPDKKPLPLPTT